MQVSIFPLWQLIVKGGPIVWLIWTMSIMIVAVALKELKMLKLASRGVQTFRDEVFALVTSSQIKKAIALCEESSLPFAKVMAAAIMKFGSTQESIRLAMDNVIFIEVQRLKQGLGVIKTGIFISALLGMLGSVSSLCIVFNAIYIRSNALAPLGAGDVASGVWQALLSAAFGIGISVIGYGFYSVCVFRLNGVIFQLGQQSNDALQLLTSIVEGNTSAL